MQFFRIFGFLLIFKDLVESKHETFDMFLNFIGILTSESILKSKFWTCTNKCKKTKIIAVIMSLFQLCFCELLYSF